MACQSEVTPLKRLLLKHARDAFVSPERVAEQWRQLEYLAPPDFDTACREYDAFVSLLEQFGVDIEWMPAQDAGLDSIYVRDASIVSDRGFILCRMGKGTRVAESGLQGARLGAAGLTEAGAITAAAGDATLEGGDTTWLDNGTLAVGRGYRTSASGIEQLIALLPDVEVVQVPLPHWKGPSDVFHLMSILSPLDTDLVLVYSPLMPVPFRELLLERGCRLVEVPSEEFESQGCNVLAVAPSVAIALDGNPETRRRMEAAGVEVHSFVGREISQKGSGGPTCLTRPLERG
jgi:arginine deiminase